MSRRPPAARLVMVVTLAAMAAAIGGPAPLQARAPSAPDRQLRMAQNPARETAGVRSYRHVDLASLPAASGVRSPYEPSLGRPDGFGAAEPRDVTAVPLEPVLATGNGDPAIGEATSFAGLARVASTPTLPSATDGEPPDPWVAAGPEHVFQAVNTEFRVTDRAGNELASAGMFEFFGLDVYYDVTEVAFFDPRVIYDSLHSRWIAIEASFDCFPQGPSTLGTGYIDVAISDGPDPTAGWGIVSIAYPDTLPDYPGLGTSTDKVVASANVFELVAGGDLGCEPDPFVGTEMDVMAWSELVGSGAVNIDFLYSPANFAPDFFSWRPALQTPATSSTVFAVAERGDGNVAYARINGSPAAGGVTTISVANSPPGGIGPFGNPIGFPQPAQPGIPPTIARAVDGRPTDAVWMNNRLVFTSTYPCVADGGTIGVNRDCVRVSELSTATPSTPTLTQDFLIAEPDTDLYMGGVGLALDGTLHAVWTRSSADAGEYASSYGAYQTTDVIDDSISDIALLSAGSGTYGGERWGDYVGVAQDPQVPNAVWQGNQFSTGGTWGWATEISLLQTGGSSYVPIAPVRVLDTRFGIGLTGAFAANAPRSFGVAGALGIPAEAIAVTGNVTVANQTAGGYVSVTPTRVDSPLSSTINFPLGDTRANNLTVPLASDGKLAAVYKAPAGRTTHLIVDITGYFLPGDEEATYATIAPLRVLDTRFGTGLSGAFVANAPRAVNITGLPDIPDDATAITGNLTVVGQSRAGYLAITKTSQVNPTTSTLNFPLGDIRANGVSVPLNAGGGLWIVYKASGGTAHVILDVTGYYRHTPAGLLFFALSPGRVMDTRPGVVLSGLAGPFGANTPRRLDVAGHWGAPVGAKAFTGNLTVVGQSAAGYVSATLASTANPTTSVLNFPLGDTRANGVTLPLNGAGREWFVYKAPGGKSAHLILDLSGYFK